MPKIASPLKNFNYLITLNGFDQVLMQSIDLGEFERTKNVHGDGDRDKKTPGRIVQPDIVLEKLVPTDVTDPFFWTWFFSSYTNAAIALMKDFTIAQLSKPYGTPGSIPVRIWQVENAWVHKFKPAKMGDLEDSNSLDTVTLSVDNCFPVKM